jgi:hypothetical protein
MYQKFLLQSLLVENYEPNEFHNASTTEFDIKLRIKKANANNTFFISYLFYLNIVRIEHY